ncbi:MAG TPA: hypothetical protein VHS97_12655, partial [Isosphaeraceae bacterium]|nr:hypothetical protein [Isosphaeraceae bacterium]
MIDPGSRTGRLGDARQHNDLAGAMVFITDHEESEQQNVGGGGDLPSTWAGNCSRAWAFALLRVRHPGARHPPD